MDILQATILGGTNFSQTCIITAATDNNIPK